MHRRTAPFLYSSCEPSELSQWPCYGDSTINIVVVIIIVIIIIIIITIPGHFCGEKGELSKRSLPKNTAYALNPLDPVPHSFPIDGDVANLLRTCYG